MSPIKSALTVTVILASAGLAGCQTTEERVHYSAVPTSPTYIYEDEEPVVYQRPATVYVAPPVHYARPAPVRYVRPPVQHVRPPMHDYRPAPPPRVVAPPRHQGAPYGGMRRPYGVNGNSPGYDTQ
ncbi:MAG: hypothetical protein OEL76_12965 [Siculibacillus sp.]|nr:hypothetical protein [Siculibacillus sp.]